MSITPAVPFGDLLKQLRKRAGMTQGDLAAAAGYSTALISALERSQRLPDVDAVLQCFAPALLLEEEPHLVAQLVAAAAAARGELPPATLTLERQRDRGARSAPALVPFRVPFPPTELIGREQEVRLVGERLLHHRGRLLTLTGPPGIGKTRLAIAVAAQIQLHYRDGALFVPLAGICDAVTMASAILAAADANENSVKPPPVLLLEFLRHRSLLLVLDNLEQLVAPATNGQAVELIADLLGACPGISVLATSRERLHLRAEQRFPVAPLSLTAAVTLFQQRAAAAASHAGEIINESAVAAICARLDRLPLAIELCAAQVDLYTPDQLLALWQTQGLDLLVGGARDLPPRQRTLRTAIAHSYGLLPEEQRTLFRRLGVFAGGFDLDAAALVASPDLSGGAGQAVASTLRALAAKSLVQPITGEPPRFLLLETLREYAMEQLCCEGEEETTRRHHYEAYLHRFRTGDSHLRGPDAAVSLARLELEQDNLRAALDWALAGARYTDAAWLLLAAGFFWYLNGHRYEDAGWLARLLPHRQALAADLRLAILIDFVASANGIAEFPTLAPFMDEIVALMEICPHKELHANAWTFMAWSAPDASQTAAALAHAVKLARDACRAPALGPEFGTPSDRDFLLAASLWGYANFLINQGQVVEANDLVTESLALFRRRGNQPFAADCLGTLGQLALLRGDIGVAQAYLQEVVAVGQTHNLPVTLAEWQPLLAIATLYAGDIREADRLLNTALDYCRQMRHLGCFARAYTCLAEAALWAHDLDGAAHQLAQSMAGQEAPHHITLDGMQQLFVAACLAGARGEYRRAAALCGAAATAHQQIRNVYGGPLPELVSTTLAAARAALDAADFTAAYSAGEQMSLAEAYAALLLPIVKDTRPDLQS